MSPQRILVVDDDPDIRTLLEVYLNGSGFKTLFAMDGVSAMSVALRERPDLIVLDLSLPAGDGLSTLAWLRANLHLSATPVVVLTGRDEESWRDKALAQGAAAFLRKPIQAELLVTTVRRALAGERPGPMPSDVHTATSRSTGAHECPHCGGELSSLPMSLDAASVQALTEGIQRQERG